MASSPMARARRAGRRALSSLRRWLGRRILTRLLTPRVPRTARQTVGVCSRCGVRFAGPRNRVELAQRVLRAHERICPGGNRQSEVATPVG